MTSTHDTQIPLTKGVHDDVPCFLSQRWIMAYVVFLFSFFTYCMRLNLSMAVVCMTRLTDTENTFDNQSMSIYFNESSSSNIRNISLDYLDVNITRAATYIVNEVQNGQCGPTSSTETIIEEDKEFAWSKTLVSHLLSGYFYGSTLTQLPGGYMATRFGPKRVLVISHLVSVMCTLLTPLAARTSPYLLLVLRIILGFGGGCIFPAVITLWNSWAPPTERGKLTIGSLSGANLGIIVTYSTSGVLCVYGFDNGWGSIFYIHGVLSLLMLLLFYYIVYDTPAKHPRITPAERSYIETALQTASRQKQKKLRTPWLEIIKSRPVWALSYTHLCANFIFYTILFTLPLYMAEVLRFEVKQNGLFSALPYIGMIIGMYLGGYLSDLILKHEVLSVIATRRLIQLSAFLGAVSLLMGAGFVDCHIRGVAVALLSFSTVFVGMGFAGFNLNHMDFCGIYTGVVFGLTNGVASMAGFLGPIAVGILTPHGTRQEWQHVFYGTAAFGVTGSLVFGTCSRGTLATWAMDGLPSDMKLSIEETISMVEREKGPIDILNLETDQLKTVK